jgi:agmatine deiminase
VTLKNGRSLNIETLELIDNKDFKEGNMNSMNRSLNYMGYYVANGAVLVPQFRAGNKDDEIKGVIKKYYPGRKIVPIDCTPLAKRTVAGLHGITQQWRGIIY